MFTEGEWSMGVACLSWNRGEVQWIHWNNNDDWSHSDLSLALLSLLLLHLLYSPPYSTSNMTTTPHHHSSPCFPWNRCLIPPKLDVCLLENDFDIFFKVKMTWKRYFFDNDLTMPHRIPNILYSIDRHSKTLSHEYLSFGIMSPIRSHQCPQKGSFLVKISFWHYGMEFFWSNDLKSLDTSKIELYQNLGWQMSGIVEWMEKNENKKPWTSGRLSPLWLTFWHWHLTCKWCPWWVTSQKLIWGKSDHP